MREERDQLKTALSGLLSRQRGWGPHKIRADLLEGLTVPPPKPTK